MSASDLAALEVPPSGRVPPANQCGACGEDFNGIRLFDSHRVGRHAYDYSAERPKGRRCLTAAEMLAAGWCQDDRGRWVDPARAQDARNRFTPQMPAGRDGVGSGRDVVAAATQDTADASLASYRDPGAESVYADSEQSR